MSIQTGFRAALLDAQQPPPAGLTDGRGAPADRRYNVYRNNIAVSLREALFASFPLIVKLLGEQNFQSLADIYLRQHPPQSPLMMHYGAQMPTFLSSFEPLAHIGYLADVARLELGLRDSYHAADAPAFDPTVLQKLAPEQLANLALQLAPATVLIQTPWPLYDIWRVNTDDTASPPKAVAQPVLITRPEFDPQLHELSPTQAVWIEAIESGKTIAQAQAVTEKMAADFDLTPLLALLLNSGALTPATS